MSHNSLSYNRVKRQQVELCANAFIFSCNNMAEQATTQSVSCGEQMGLNAFLFKKENKGIE